MNKRLAAEHGIVCRVPGEKLGYFGWPTVARMDDGTLVVASSGLRSQHVCPWGKTVLNVFSPGDRTWSTPRVIHKTPLDDRDAGVISLGGQQLLVTWFTSDTRLHVEGCRQWLGEEEVKTWQATLATWTDDLVKQWLGSWLLLSADAGATWGPPVRVPVSTPHGPIRLRNGDLCYLGKSYRSGWSDMEDGRILACRSSDGGRTWAIAGEVPIAAGTTHGNYHEPHLVELPSGQLLAMIRLESGGKYADVTKAGFVSFSLMQTESNDGGKTWSTAHPLGFHGSPPHLLRHSSGLLILTYGFRQAPYGQRVAFSRDDGQTWDHDWIIRDDGPDGDLGYPSTIELPDRSLFTVCYQKVPGDAKCSLLWSRWTLPSSN